MTRNLYFLLCSVLIGCGGITTSKFVLSPNQDFYQDYVISIREDKMTATVSLTHEEGDHLDRRVEIDSPASLKLDNQLLKSTNAFYATAFPVNAFIGDHTITYTDAQGNRTDYKFSFQGLDFLSYPKKIKSGDSLIISVDTAKLAVKGFVEIIGDETATFVKTLDKDPEFSSNKEIVIEWDLIKKFHSDTMRLVSVGADFSIPIKLHGDHVGRIRLIYYLKPIDIVIEK